MPYTSDRLGSDDMDEIFELSRNDFLPNPLHATTSETNLERPIDEPSYLAKPRLQARLGAVAQEISSIETSIADLQKIKAELLREENTVKKELNAIDSHRSGVIYKDSTNGEGKGVVMLRGSQINYMDEFEWSGPLKVTMKSVFGIDNFRLCQEGVCNASIDGRDVVCVMPTGGGKSLTYQLPAIMSRGCTLVISPLLSLITDQILHLRQAGVEAVMLTGATPKEESKAIFSRLSASTREAIGSTDGQGDKEIKLCYVTPEKIAKSKTFTSMLEKLATVGKLARIVIDEAHCVSQLGHDFRPDYKKLSILRQLFPHVPILALSATCPPKVLQDLLLTLRLKAVVDGNAAAKTGTVYFTAPLYRKNLHYSVLPKPSSAPAVIQAMTDYILEHHADDSGIIYCLSKKDTETVAQGIMDASGNRVKAGVYHSDVTDAQKERLHVKWRSGEVQVVCATIAFGLGIDKSNVRFVLHHSMSKSLDGFYQESGRAGRDGNDAHCVLYYRGQDASRLSGLICGEIEGQEKLHQMLHFAQNLIDCRKIQFANYFSSSSSLALSSWSDTTAAGTLSRCGHCDNCTRSPDSITTRDVTLESWQILRVIERVSRDGGRVTVGMLADLVRGAGGGAFAGGTGGKRKGKAKATASSKEKVDLDLNDIAGGKIVMNKADVEVLIIQLLLSHHLKEEFHSTAYSINVYVTSGPQALRLTRLSRQQIQDGEGSRVTCTFLNKVSTKQKASSKSISKSKHKPPAALESGGEEEINIDIGSDDDSYDDGHPLKASSRIPKAKSKPRAKPRSKQTVEKSGWMYPKSTPSNRKFNALTKPALDSEHRESDNDIPWDIDNVREDHGKGDRGGEKSSATQGLDIIGQIDPTIFVPSSDAEDSDTNGWSYNLSGPTKRKGGGESSAEEPAPKRLKVVSSSKSRSRIEDNTNDVVVLSSD